MKLMELLGFREGIVYEADDTTITLTTENSDGKLKAGKRVWLK